jgi:hypothetical protein
VRHDLGSIIREELHGGKDIQRTNFKDLQCICYISILMCIHTYIAHVTSVSVRFSDQFWQVFAV